jgi:Carboxypeptidase regulatory-like domain/TonB-dependent Receptor Plug Domain
MRTAWIILRLGLLIMFLSGIAPAQTAGTGALTGEITDPNGAVVAGVQVSAINEATGEKRDAVSQDNGIYVIALLPPGSYRLEFSKRGFKSSVKTGLQINVTETKRLDLHLEVGAVEEKVIVVSGSQLLQTESSALGSVTNHEAVANLPLVTRNYTQIVTLSPGIAAGVTNAAALGRGSSGESQGGFRAHGASGGDNNFQMNGVQINDLQASGFLSGGVAVPNPDAIQEFKVQTGLYDASYGRNAGAVVDVVTRSGGNKFHGAAFEFLRNDALNANEFFRNAAGQKKGVLKQNQFGFTLGGPIKKDKLLFFGSYQGIRQINGVGGGATSNFFSPAFTDDRSRAALGKLFAGQIGAQGGVAVAADGSNISAPALAILSLKQANGQYAVPTPQTVDSTKAFALRGFSALSVPANFDENQFLINMDYVQSSKSRIAGRFFLANSTQNQPLPPTNLGGPPSPGFNWLTDNRLRNFSLAHTYTFSSHLLNQAELGFHRTEAPTIQQELFKWSDVGVKAPIGADAFPEISVSGSMTLGGNGQGLNVIQKHLTFQDSVTYIRGRHTFRFGGGITRSNLDLSDFHFLSGVIFLSWADFLLGLPGAPVASGGNGTAISNVFASVDLPGQLDRSWRLTDGNAFIQDDFKLTPSLTLNLGLRYERLENLGDQLGRNSGFDTTLANPNPPAAGTVQGYVVSENIPISVPAGVKQLDNTYGILGKHQNNFGPRLGFAWRLPKSFLPLTERMVLRGGYGMYFTRATGQPFIQLATSPPFALLRQVQGVPNAAASFANPFGPDLAFPQFPAYSPTTARSIVFIDQGYRPPLAQEFGLNVQTDLGHNFMLDMGYVGNRGTHQILNRSLNQALLASPSNPIRGQTTNTVANVGLRVPIQGFTAPGLNDVDSSASSWYHGLEASLSKRLSKGLQFLAAYTFAHAYSTTGRSTLAGGTSGITGNQNDPRANYGLSEFDRVHRFVFSYVYQLPGARRFNSVVNGLLTGWSLAGVTTIQSGAPLTLTGTNANNVFGITSDRAQLAPGCTYDNLANSGSIQSKLTNYFNKPCILRNAAGAAIWPIVGDDGRATAFGNSGVGIVFGPGQNSSDIAIIKRTPLHLLGESGNVEFRTEFFNAFNHTQFSNPSTNVSSAAFGTITTTAVNPRIIQFALKLNF